MDIPLYDRDLDASPSAPWMAPQADRLAPEASTPEAESAGARSSLVGWFEGLSAPDMVGVGLMFGVAISAPVVLALRPSVIEVLVLIGLFLSPPLVREIGRGLQSLRDRLMRQVPAKAGKIQAPRLDLRALRGEFESAIRWISGQSGRLSRRRLLLGLIIGWLAIDFLSALPWQADPRAAAIRAPRFPVPANRGMPVVFPRNRAPIHAAGGKVDPPQASKLSLQLQLGQMGAAGNLVMPAIPLRGSAEVASPLKREVPPLIEEAPEAQPEIAAEDLKRLRDEFRNLGVLRLQPLLEGVRRTCNSEDWLNPGLRDYRLEFELDELIYRVKRATRRPDLELPVHFGDLRSGVADEPSNLLMVTGTRQLRSATRSILIVDGDIHLMFAHDCLILATGLVGIQWGDGNVIVAGGAVNDKESNGRRKDGRPSLLVSGETIEISHSSNLICSAPKGVSGMLVTNAALLNSPVILLDHQTGCSAYSSKRLDFRTKQAVANRR